MLRLHALSNLDGSLFEAVAATDDDVDDGGVCDDGERRRSGGERGIVRTPMYRIESTIRTG